MGDDQTQHTPDAPATPPSRTEPDGSGSALGAVFGPILQDTCEGWLGPIDWFRTPWQQGGAATGFSTWADPNEAGAEPTPVMVKLPVPPIEYRWSRDLGAIDGGPTPRLFACGDELGAYHFAWLVVERLPGQPVSKNLARESLIEMLRAAARFYKETAAIEHPAGRSPKDPPAWSELVQRGREALEATPVNEADRWLALLDRIEPRLEGLAARWAQRAVTCWCHGDLHPHNAMRREGSSGDHAVLIDLALVHPGSWIEDAIYLERLFWGHEDKLFGVDPLEDLAAERSRIGLPNVDDYRELADIRRTLMAASVPAFLGREGAPVYVDAARERLERLIETVVAG